MALHKQPEPTLMTEAQPVSPSLASSVAHLREEMQAFYRTIRRERFETYTPMVHTRAAIWEAMDRYAEYHPDCASWALKARLHQEIAARFDPVIFPHSPFFFEMGLRPAESGIVLLLFKNWINVRVS